MVYSSCLNESAFWNMCMLNIIHSFNYPHVHSSRQLTYYINRSKRHELIKHKIFFHEFWTFSMHVSFLPPKNSLILSWNGRIYIIWILQVKTHHSYYYTYSSNLAHYFLLCIFPAEIDFQKVRHESQRRQQSSVRRTRKERRQKSERNNQSRISSALRARWKKPYVTHRADYDGSKVA